MHAQQRWIARLTALIHPTRLYASAIFWTKKNPTFLRGFSLITSLTITYFHTGCSTIIGVSSFHGPVRDGKGWYRVTMVIRHNLYKQLLPIGQQRFESGRSIVLYFLVAICVSHKAQRVFLSLYL